MKENDTNMYETLKMHFYLDLKHDFFNWKKFVVKTKLHSIYVHVKLKNGKWYWEQEIWGYCPLNDFNPNANDY